MGVKALITKARSKSGELTRREVYARALKSPLRDDAVMYESFSGNGALCNPEAVFHELTSSPDFDHLRHIWVLKKTTPDYETVVESLKSRGNVEIVEYRSPRYWTALGTSKFVINNATFPWEFVKRAGQIYANLWHGTPLKKMGYDVEDGGPDARNIVRNFVAADYLVAANERMSDMYLRAYKMSNIFKGSLLETGYPRTDRQRLNPAEAEAAKGRLAEAGINIGHRKLVVFAPTWKGSSFYSPSQDGERLLEQAKQLEDLLGADRFQVVLKVHQTLAAHASSLPSAQGRLMPHSVPTNVGLGLADMLITDYSSIYVDYLATGRPLAFYIPDLEQYESSRGIYDTLEELPGPVSTSLEDLAQDLRLMGDPGHSDAVRWSQVRDEAAHRFTPREDGRASERFVDVVFRGQTDVEGVRQGFADGRESILMYLGGMSSNGITSSALNLLRNIDHDRFDVSVLYSHSRANDKRKNERLIDPRVRLFSRQGTVTATLRERTRYQRQNAEGLPPHGPVRHELDELWTQEARRCFGDASFDHAIDFSGYSPFWSRIILGSRADRKSVWLHNDLLADSRRTVDGQQAHKANLESMFTLYRDFDSLVSVSSALAELNRENLSEFAPRERFASAVNTIDAERIIDMSGTVEAPLIEGAQLNIAPGAPLSSAIDELAAAYGTTALEQAVTRTSRLQKFNLGVSAERPVFVSVGRLSPEKNHERLIRAFASVHAEVSTARLLILGGGPLKKHLLGLVEELGLQSAVNLAGPQDNPFLLMGQSDYFVLSSDYEGQPMVILEARTLGLPVISTAFGSVSSAVPEGSGIVVERDVDALAGGMLQAVRSQLVAHPFDPNAYNADAMAQFYAAISTRTRPAHERGVSSW